MQKIRFGSTIKKGVFMLSLLTLMGLAHAEKVSVGQQAPLFTLHAQDGSTLDLASRQGKGWTQSCRRSPSHGHDKDRDRKALSAPRSHACRT